MPVLLKSHSRFCCRALLDIVEGGGEDIAEQYNRKEDAVRLYCYLDSELKEQEKQVFAFQMIAPAFTAVSTIGNGSGAGYRIAAFGAAVFCGAGGLILMFYDEKKINCVINGKA